MRSRSLTASALLSSCVLLAACGSDGQGALGGVLASDEPPAAAPAELLLSDVTVAGHTFGAETVPLEDVKEMLDATTDQNVAVDPPECDADMTVGIERLDPATSAIKTSMSQSSTVVLTVSEDTSNAGFKNEDLDACGEVTVTSELFGMGTMTITTRTSEIQADAPGGVDDFRALKYEMSGDGPTVEGISMADLMPGGTTVLLTGVERERMILVTAESPDGSRDEAALTDAAEEIFAAQVEKVRDAE